MRAARLLAGLSTAMFLLAVGIAAWARPETPLALLLPGRGDGLAALREAVAAIWPAAWQAVFLPVLDRPGWLVPGMAALVAGGLAVSINPPPETGGRR